VIVIGLVLAALAALLHVYIFVLESLLWTTPRARSTFGTTAGEAESTKELAFNQGFYNLFLAIVTIVGVIVLASGATAVGAALVFTGTGSMVAAALVLLLSSPGKRRAALTQMAPGLLAVLALGIGLAAS
jgi:putative membrane protein